MHRVLWLLFLSAAAAAERINHEGRILGDPPAVTQPLLFNTPAADSVVAAMQIMPHDSPWNEDISGRPVLSNSNAMIARITADLDPARRTLRLFPQFECPPPTPRDCRCSRRWCATTNASAGWSRTPCGSW